MIDRDIRVRPQRRDYDAAFDLMALSGSFAGRTRRQVLDQLTEAAGVMSTIRGQPMEVRGQYIGTMVNLLAPRDDDRRKRLEVRLEAVLEISQAQN